MYRVLIVEDDPMVRSLYEIFINHSDAYEVVATIDNASLAQIYCAGNNVDLILMDVCTSLSTSGLDAAEKIKKSYPNIKIIIMTSQPECTFLQRAKDAHVDSFWYKEANENNILTIMDQTMNGESIYPEQSPILKIGAMNSDEFSETELKILKELITGETDEEIAKRLNMSPWTIRKYIKLMLEKTQFKSRTQLAVVARESGLVIRGY